MISKSILSVLGIGLLALAQGCATASQVPEINSEGLPAVGLKALSPRSIQIEVKDNRAVNQKAGNSAQVEKSVRDAVSAALVRGGVEPKEKAPHLLNIALVDSVVEHSVDGEKTTDGECVKATGVLKAKWGSKLTAIGTGCTYMKREDGFARAGDVSEAFTLALKLVLETLDKHQMELLRGSH